jgi:hypothetical protein
MNINHENNLKVRSVMINDCVVTEGKKRQIMWRRNTRDFFEGT